jgi:hypothetical protein
VKPVVTTLCVFLGAATAYASERETEPLGRPGTPYVVEAGAPDGAAEMRGATRVTPIPERLLRDHLERMEKTPEKTAPPRGPIEPAPAARASR